MSQNHPLQDCTAAGDADDGRPEDCTCWSADLDLPCWHCFRAGFDGQNPAEPGANDPNRDSDEVATYE